MNCKRFKMWIIDLAAGAPGKGSEEHDAELHRHIAACPECREAFQREIRLETAIDRALERSLVGEPSYGFVSQVRQRIAADANRQKFGFLRPILSARWAGLAVLFAVVVAGGIFWKYHQPQLARSRAVRMARAENPRLEDAATGSRSIKKRLTAANPGLKEAGSRGTVSVPWERAAASTTPRLARHARAPRAAKASTPEVIVPKNQMALVLQLYYGTRSGEIDGASLVAVPPGFKREPDGSLGIAPIVITPIQIAKLEVGPASPPGGRGSVDQARDGFPLPRE